MAVTISIVRHSLKTEPPSKSKAGVVTDAEFKQKLLEERAVYQRILNPTTQ